MKYLILKTKFGISSINTFLSGLVLKPPKFLFPFFSLIGAVALMFFTTQTKSAVAETLSNKKNSLKIEQTSNIQKATSHDLEANFYMEQSYPDTNDVKEFFEPAFETPDERKQFYMLRNRATHSDIRYTYEENILSMFFNLKNNEEKTVLTLLLLDPERETEIGQRAYTIVSKNEKYTRLFGDMVKNIKLAKEIEKGKKEIDRLDKEIERLKKKEQTLDERLKLLNGVENNLTGN